MKEFPVLSGNTSDEIIWSDHKRYAPMMPKVPLIAKCPACGALLLPGQNYYTGPDAQKLLDKAVRTVECPLNFSEYLAAFDLLENPRTACFLALHSYNDLYREQRADEAEEASNRAAFVELATKFLPLLDDANPEDYLLKAEIYRQIGSFNQCIEMLDARKPDNGYLDSVAAQIRAQAHAGNTRVFVLE